MSETELVGKDELLKAMTMCNSCPDFNLNDLRGKGDNNYQLYDWLIHNLPTAQYVLGKLVELIFSNNLTTGDEKQDEILNNFYMVKRIQKELPTITYLFNQLRNQLYTVDLVYVFI